MSERLATMALTGKEVSRWLREEDRQRLEFLWHQADKTRQLNVGDQVHFRGLLEISNHCRCNCHYCGLRADRRDLRRYRLSDAEILAGARRAAKLGCGTLVLQAGEDPGITRDGLAALIRRIKAETPLAVTLSLGERSVEELVCWRAAGADRYFMRFETSDPRLFAAIHPPRRGRPAKPDERIWLLHVLRQLGYEIGSGMMIGIPGQTYGGLVDDLLLCRALDLDMVGVGPYLPHPDTPLGADPARVADAADRVPASELLVHKTIALARLVCPEANIPATTALGVLGTEAERRRGLTRGANVLMPCLTPLRYQPQYEVYPGKGADRGDPDDLTRFRRWLEQLGRPAGRGPGGRRDLRAQPM